MKNLILLPLFAIVSLLILVMILLVIFIPRLLTCLNLNCIRRYQRRQQILRRARRIKKARLVLAYKKQISRQLPLAVEIERSRGCFIDRKTGSRNRDDSSLKLANGLLPAVTGETESKVNQTVSTEQLVISTTSAENGLPARLTANRKPLPLWKQVGEGVRRYVHQMKDHYSH